MPWFRVDDKFHSHKKAARAGTEPLGLWLLCGSWASDQLTDGFVPDYVARRFDPNADDLAARLVAAGLWAVAERDGDRGWQFHDWDGMNPTRNQVESKREAEREKKRAQRERVSRGDDGRFEPMSRAVSPGDNLGDDAGDSRGDSRGLSSVARPDPSLSKRTPSSAAADGRFDEFWLAYPKKVDKGHGRKAYVSALKRATHDEIMAGLAGYCLSVRGTEAKYIANPATWLNGDRWADETAAANPQIRVTGDGEMWDLGEWGVR